MMPRLRVHNEGERVRTGDPIVLEALETSHRVTLSPTLSLLSVDPSIDTGSASSFRLRLYRSVEEEQMEGTLLCGRACTLFHKEAEAYLQCDATVAKAGGQLSMTPASRSATATSTSMPTATSAATSAGTSAGSSSAADSHAIWQVQSEDETAGTTCKWEGRFRLRHACSSRFLSVSQSLDTAESGVLSVRLVGSAQSRNDPDSTLFTFVPQYPQEGAISHTHLLHIKHIKLDAFLHVRQVDDVHDDAGDGNNRVGFAPSGATEQKEPPARGEGGRGPPAAIAPPALSLQPPSLTVSLPPGTGGGGGGGGDGSGQKRFFEIVATRTAHDQDIFGIRSVDMEVRIALPSCTCTSADPFPHPSNACIGAHGPQLRHVQHQNL